MSADVAVIGAGAWGTALAIAATRAGREVLLWGRDEAQRNAMRTARENQKALPGVALPASLTVVDDLTDIAVATVIVAIPTQALRSVAVELTTVLPSGAAVIAAAKGIEQATGRFVSEILSETLPLATPAILSGPSFAADVSRGLPTAVTLAAADDSLAKRLASLLGSPGFRIYHSDDLRGVEIGGAAKNVLAIAAGIVAGAGLGESARAAVVTRGFAELARFASANGARPETLMGLSGLGDLLLSASSLQSRNFAFGHALGRGEPTGQAGSGKLVEGAFTASILVEMAKKQGVEMPISQAVDAVLSGRSTIRGAIDALLSRPQRGEA